MVQAASADEINQLAAEATVIIALAGAREEGGGEAGGKRWENVRMKLWEQMSTCHKSWENIWFIYDDLRQDLCQVETC